MGLVAILSPDGCDSGVGHPGLSRRQAPPAHDHVIMIAVSILATTAGDRDERHHNCL
jgi:hypothetical protein